jgi:hypothetical protein
MRVDDVAGHVRRQWVWQTLLATSSDAIYLNRRGFKCMSMMWRGSSVRPCRFTKTGAWLVGDTLTQFLRRRRAWVLSTPHEEDHHFPRVGLMAGAYKRPLFGTT